MHLTMKTYVTPLTVYFILTSNDFKRQVKLKDSLWLIKHYSMKPYGVVETDHIASCILNLNIVYR